MLRSFRQKGKWLTLGGLAIFVASLNGISSQNLLIAVICLAGFLLACSSLIGSRLAPASDQLIQISVGLSATIAWISLVGSIIYYVGSIHTWHFTTLAVITLLLCGLLSPRTLPPTPYTLLPTPYKILTGMLICLGAWILAIAPVQITQAIRSIWLVIDPRALIALSLATLLLITAFSLFSKRLRFLSLFLILLSVFLVPTLVYPLGYGFDPFIHRTTIAHIIEFGTITPKPLYYIGQYALELMATMAFGVPLYETDIFLVPILAALLLTGSALYGFKDQQWGPLALLLIPFGIFISTTPQALSYIFTASIIFLSLPRLRGDESPAPFWHLTLLAAAALITHPLAGIPACLYVVLLWLSTKSIHSTTLSVTRNILFWLCALAGAVIIPAIFLLQATLSNLAIHFSLRQLAWDQLTLSGFWRNQFSSIPDLLYLIIDNSLWIALALGVVGAIVLSKQHARWREQLPLLMIILLIVNYLILTLTLEFDFLIEYERTNYALRLITLIFLFLLPHIGIAINAVFTILLQRPQTLRLGWTILLTALATAGMYGAFPRHDNYARSSGFNVSTSDINAAVAIHEEGGDEAYIVLSNQAVSAAALELYGFRQYFHEDIFYYPIPTGGELYEYYLQMADDEPTRVVMEEAMDLAGVSKGFFVLNNYWWDAGRIREAAKQEADSWFGLGSGDDAITVFIFER